MPLLEKYNVEIRKVVLRTQEPTNNNHEIKISIKFKQGRWKKSLARRRFPFYSSTSVSELSPAFCLCQHIQFSEVKATKVILSFNPFHSVADDKHLKTTSLSEMRFLKRVSPKFPALLFE